MSVTCKRHKLVLNECIKCHAKRDSETGKFSFPPCQKCSARHVPPEPSCTRYNGWSNYETWNVKLWMDNDEGSYSYWRDETRDCLAGCDGDKDELVRSLADRLKDFHEENRPEVSGCYADLLGAALSSVDWYEIAASLVDDNTEDSDFAKEEEAETE